MTRLTERLGATDEPLRAALASLSHERDSEGFFEAIYEIGKDLEDEGRVELAATLYQSIAEALPDAGVARRSRSRLDAILGRGAVLPRAEFLGRRFAETSSDPVTLTAMSTAGAVFRMTRLACLIGSRPLATPTFANAVALISETTAFTATVRAGNSLLNRPQDWSSRALAKEFAGGALSLFGLRAAGTASGYILRGLGTSPGLARDLLRLSLPQAGMFAGILLAHRLEQSIGLRPRLSGETTLTDGFATLLQFQVGGRAAHQLLGEGHGLSERRAKLIRDTQLRFEGLNLGPRPNFSFAPLWAASLWLGGCHLHGNSWEHLSSLIGASLPMVAMAFWAPPRNRGNALRILTDLQTRPLRDLSGPIGDFAQYVTQGRRLSPAQFKAGFDRLLEVMRLSDNLESSESIRDALADKTLDAMARRLESHHVGSDHVQTFLETLTERRAHGDYFTLTLRVERQLARKKNLLADQYEHLGDFALEALEETGEDGEVPLAAQEVLEALLQNPRAPTSTLNKILESRRHNSDIWRPLAQRTLIEALRHPGLEETQRGDLFGELNTLFNSTASAEAASEIASIHQKLMTRVSPSDIEHQPLLATLASLCARFQIIPPERLFKDFMVHFDNPSLNQAQQRAMRECIRQALGHSPGTMAEYVNALTPSGLEHLTEDLAMELNQFLV
ncbi:MAG: hypothetical protein K8R69_06955, partial [Deltaproteobacteria bacterium]|nr:hypothetical protein [Deltaproteobacteria bacterium]